MNLYELPLSACTSIDLLSQLQNIDIRVPPITKGRKKEHRERYVMARFLATIAESKRVCYPLTVEHYFSQSCKQDSNKPDFGLSQPNGKIGVECVEAVPEEWYKIQAIRERKYPDALIFGQRFQSGKDARSFTNEERENIANGSRTGSIWVGNMAEKQWAEAMEYFIGNKTEKLRADNYSEFSNMWLLVQDEWRVPIITSDLDEVQLAVELLLKRIDKFFIQPCFSAIHICCGDWLLSFKKNDFTIEPIRNLWQS